MRFMRGLRIERMSDAAVPAAFLISSLLGSALPAGRLFMSALEIHLLSLGSCHGVRAAFACQTSIRRVRGSVLCSLALQFAGFLAAILLRKMLAWDQGLSSLSLLFGGLFLNIEHTFYEYLFSVGDGYSASMCHGLTALLTLAGLLLDAEGGLLPWIPVTTGLSALVSIVIGCAMGGGLPIRLNVQVIRCAPRMLLQSALYPSIFIAWAAISRPSTLHISFFSGLLVLEFCRSPFRRSTAESRSMNRTLLALCSGSVLALITGGFITSFRLLIDIPSALILASLCALAAFGRIGRESV